MTQTDLIGRIGKEEIYLLNDYEDAVVRISASPIQYFVKFKGRRENEARSDSRIVTDAIIEREEITAGEYAAF